MKKTVFTLMLYITSAYAADNEPAMHDYARGMELATEQPAAIYRLPLPEEVYRTVTKEDLSDLRVFNQAQEPVPHIIQRTESKLMTGPAALDLPYFPLSIDTTERFADSLDITVSSAGKVIHIQSETGSDDAQQAVVKYYLIDASHIDIPIDSIDFQLTGGESSYAKVIRLEYSHDLNQWSTLVNRSTLTRLAYDNHLLENKRVKLPNKRIKYLRFTWLDDANGLTLKSVKANFKERIPSGEKYWSTAKFISKDEDTASYQFDTGGVFNIEQINIELPEDNSLIDVVIESRPNDDTEWRWRFNGLFYKLYLQGTEVTGGPVDVRPGIDRFWRVRLQSIDGIGQAEPVLRYAWRANQLYFLARGKPPYTLAYGNANVTQTSHASSRLMNIINDDRNGEMLAMARPGKIIQFKGDAALLEQFTLPWERIVLWLVLIAGVLVIAVMVLRLSRKMQQG